MSLYEVTYPVPSFPSVMHRVTLSRMFSVLSCTWYVHPYGSKNERNCRIPARREQDCQKASQKHMKCSTCPRSVCLSLDI